MDQSRGSAVSSNLLSAGGGLCWTGRWIEWKPASNLIPSQSKGGWRKKTTKAFFLCQPRRKVLSVYCHTHSDIRPIVAGPTVSRMPLSWCWSGFCDYGIRLAPNMRIGALRSMSRALRRKDAFRESLPNDKRIMRFKKGLRFAPQPPELILVYIPATESVSSARQDGRERRREEDKQREGFGTSFYCLPFLLRH